MADAPAAWPGDVRCAPGRRGKAGKAPYCVSAHTFLAPLRTRMIGRVLQGARRNIWSGGLMVPRKIKGVAGDIRADADKQNELLVA